LNDCTAPTGGSNRRLERINEPAVADAQSRVKRIHSGKNNYRVRESRTYNEKTASHAVTEQVDYTFTSSGKRPVSLSGLTPLPIVLTFSGVIRLALLIGACMNRAACVLFLLLGFAFSSGPQSAGDLSAMYPVVTSYEVRPGILMIPRYTADGQVCEMSFARQHTTRSGVYLDSLISDKLANDIYDELVPPAVRGHELHDAPDPSGTVVTVGSTDITLYNYENIQITYETLTGQRPGVVAVVISWKNRTCRNEGNVLPLERYPR
jgi:hypothetical protein